MESARDPELGQESTVSRSQRQSSVTLTEPLLRDSSGYSFTDNDGTVHVIPSYMEELVPKDAYVQLSSDPPHVLELKTEVGRVLSRVSLYRQRMLAEEEIRRRMSRSVNVIAACHLAFMSAVSVAVFHGYFDGKLWSVAFWVMLGESAVLLVVLAWKMVALYEYDNQKQQPENLILKPNLQNMPAVRERLGEQEFKDFTEPLQKFFDQVCARILAEPVELSFCDMVKSYFKNQDPNTE